MSKMRIGYIRVSTEEQNEDRQLDALRPVCSALHVEKCSAVSGSRPVFESLISGLQQGDTLVVWSLDRAFRSARDALNIQAELKARGIDLEIVSLGADTGTADGLLAFTIVAAVAEHERNRLSERTKQGLAAAKRRGKRLGKRPKITPEQAASVSLRLAKGERLSDLAFEFQVHPQTLRRHLKSAAQDLS